MSPSSLDIDLHSVCRICLSQTDMSEHLFNIFSDAIVDGMLVSLPDVIEYCVDIQATNVDGVPHQICQSCKGKMFEFYLFKLKCHRTDDILRVMLEKNTYSKTDELVNGEEMLDTSLCHEAQLTDPSEATLTLLCSSESMLSVNSVDESLQDEIHSDARTERSLGLGSPLAVNMSSTGRDSVSSVAASLKEEYIEEIYEELPSSSPTSNAPIDDHRSSAEIHMTVTPICRNVGDYLVCEICRLAFPSKKRLKRHWKLHDDSKAFLSQISFFSCTACKIMYLSEDNLNEHSKICPRQVGAPNDDDHQPEAFPCGICDASFTNLVHLKQHIITHMEKFPCPYEGCGCEYASLVRLNMHVNIKHVDYFSSTCPHCKTDIDLADLTHHLRTACKAKHFNCSHCDKKFLSSRALAMHLKKQEQTFQCSECDKSFSSRANYKLHLRTHTGERPYVCRVCNKSYKTSSLRTAHMDSHIEGKTFECGICGKCLQTRTTYRNHIKRHLEERNYGCDICGKKFYTKYILRTHQEMVHKIKRAAGSDQLMIDLSG
uniref:Uncharacterized protein n=1 Tax=Anopheles atroparvus TaxID=41427 RepID=A0AAG5DPE1_ANOAO